MTTSRAAFLPSPASRPADGGDRRLAYVVGAALFAGALALFLPSVRHAFVSYDDIGFVTKNDWVRNGLTWANIGHAFRTSEMANWHPLTWISYLVDAEFSGMEPWGYHLTNTVLHALNTLLVFVVLRRLTGTLGRSAFVAALFGAHPLHVESVAWVAERKDVLSTVFWLLTMWFYAEWVARNAAGRKRAGLFYGASLATFAAGLMAKPMLVTLPCVLLLLDFWPLRRWGGEARERTRLSRLVTEKIPFFALSAADSVVTFKVQAGIGAVQGLTRVPWLSRVDNAVVSYAVYLGKCFFPSNLAVYYPYADRTGAAVAGALVVLAVVSIVVVAGFRRRPYGLFGWLWFLGTLVPVIGLVQVGGQAMADRYAYIPSLGVFIAVTWALADVAVAWRAGRMGLVVAAGLALCASVAMTNRQLAYWQNSGTLWGEAVAVTQRNVPAHLGLGYYYSETPGRLADAITEYREAVRLAPDSADAHRSLAALLARRPATLAEAVAEYQAALRLDPTFVPAYLALGAAAEQLPGRLPEAIAAYQAAVRLEPKNADAHNRLGNALSQVPGQVEAAIAEYRKTLQLQPDWVEVHLNLGATLAGMPGHLAEAIAEYETVVRAKPDYAEAHNNLANALARVPDRAAAAATEYETAIRLRPDYFEARFNYAVLLGTVLGRRADAIAQLEAVLKLRPDFQPAHALLRQFQPTP